MYIYIYIPLYISICIYINIQSFLLYVALLYLAEAVITMPSREIITWICLIWKLALAGNGQSAKCEFSTSITSLIPNNQKSKFAAAAANFSNF